MKKLKLLCYIMESTMDSYEKRNTMYVYIYIKILVSLIVIFGQGLVIYLFFSVCHTSYNYLLFLSIEDRM